LIFELLSLIDFNRLIALKDFRLIY